MTAGVPWSVSAVDPDTWDAAREAARRAGLSVGEWLQLAIRENSIGGHGRGRNPATGFDRRLDDLADQINLIARRNAEYRPAPPMPVRDAGGEQIAASLDALTDRIDELMHGMARADRNNGRDEISGAIRKLDSRIESLLTERPSGSQDSEVENKLDEMARVISAMSERLERETAYTASPELAPTAAELDAAVAEIIERQSALDGVPSPRPARNTNGHHAPATPHIAKLEHQLKTIADEMQSMRKASAKQSNTPLIELRRDIQELARVMADLAPRRTLESLESTVDALARKVDRSGARRDDRAAQSVLAALDEIRTAISTVRPAESFVSVEGDLNALSNKLDVINAKSIDGTTVARIQNQIQEVRDLLSNALPAETLQNVVAQIEMVASKVDRLGAPDDSGMRDVVGSLERRIDALAERIEIGAQHGSPGEEALERINSRLDALQTALDRAENPMGLEETMRAVVERLDASEAKLSGLGSIERGISDLSEQFDKARASAMEVAERAAKTALRELQAARLGGLQPQSAETPGAAPHISIPRPLAGEAPAPSREIVAQESQQRFTRATPATVQLSSERVATDGLPADFPLEPGSGAPKSRPTPVQQRIAQSEAAVADIAPRPVEGNQRTSDFIAAARRAAQAAAIETPGQTEATQGKQGAFSRGRRAILLGLVVAMIGFSAVRFFDVSLIANLIGSEPSAPAVETPAKETPAKETPLIPDAAPAPQLPLIPDSQRSLIPGLIDPTAALAPASGNISPATTKSMLSQNPDPAIITNSTPQPPRRNQQTANVAPATTPNVAPTTAPQVAAANELPAGIGNPALRAAAINGDPDAAYEIAERYLAGRGVNSDVNEAIRWFERAVNKGSAVAAFRLGMAFEKGLGVPKDRGRARTNYVLAANAGHLKAMHNLAVMTVEEPRPDNKPDYASAIPWFRKASEHGLRDSQYNLGVLYARGLGVPQNLAESFRWFALAANQGDADAVKKRDEVAARLDQQTLVATRLAVQTWTAQPVNQGANAAYLKAEWQKTAETPAKKKSKK